MRRIAIVILLLATVSTLSAQYPDERAPRRPGTGNPDEQLVPWKFLPKGADLVKGPVVVYWLPASLKEVENSALQRSSVLLDDAIRCVGFVIVDPADSATIAKLGARPPMALIAGSDGKVIQHVDNTRVKAVEAMLTAEMNARDDQVLRDLAKAKSDKSVELYKKIWDDRCLYPLIGVEAQRGLKELGVIVKEPPSTLMADPNLKVTPPAKKARE